MKLSEVRDQIEIFYGSPLSVMSDSLRGFITAAPNHDLIAADFSNIEGRKLAWLAGEDWKIKAFSDFDLGIGPDIYKLMAHGIYGVSIESVSSFQRLIGKVAELACGYQGGIGAFLSMAAVYLVKIPDSQAAPIVAGWRQKNSNIVRYWYDVERAAKAAVYKPGTKCTVGPNDHRQIRYVVNGSFLWCRLPSGRVLCYPYPKIWKQVWVVFSSISDPTKTFKKTFHGPDGATAEKAAKIFAYENDFGVEDISDPSDVISYMAENSLTRKFGREVTYGGSLVENITQASSRCLLSEAMKRLEKRNYPIVMHVHDEVVSEKKFGEGSVKEMEEIMCELPTWAKGLPVSAEGWRGRRYRK